MAEALTRLRHAVAALLGAIVVVAAYLDGRAHLLNLPDSFFTWWHVLLYGGVTALTAWLLVIGRAHGVILQRGFVMPPGYRLSLIGAVLFFTGGVADLVWHSVFGVEAGLEALLSPTHLWLFTAGALMLSGPVRAAVRERRVPEDGPRWPAIISVTSLAGLGLFVLSYLSAYSTDAPQRPLPDYPEGTPEHAAVEIPASWGLASYVVTSLVMALPLAYLILRWRLPFGAATVYAAFLAGLAVVLMDFHRGYMLAAIALAGLVVDVLLLMTAHRGTSRRAEAVAAAGLLPLVAWTGQLALAAVVETVAWPAELVSGVIVLSAGLAALAAGFLAAPAGRPSTVS
jgi:hypothetical protein